ncbi:MAG: AlpA family phage regulatory protein [Solidesulfovibrio sp.]|uniref:helix-turn-helix transcriptional regulator n=1 Tax=Solidesulfovibrio sp. TaxID=2910990 RepID=UPI003158B373
MHGNIPFPTSGFVRVKQIIGNRKAGEVGPIPISRSAWWAGVKDGRYPQPVKLGPRTTAWRAEDINALIERLGA